MNKFKIIGFIGIGIAVLASIIFLIVSLIVYNNKTNDSSTNEITNPTVNENEGNYNSNLIPLTKPTVSIIFSDISFDCFDYEIVLNDESNCGKITYYKIYDSEQVVYYEHYNNSLDKTISNAIFDLFGNKEYFVEVEYQFDINDGSGLQKEKYSNSTKTLVYGEPKLEVNQLSLNYNSYEFNLNIIDDTNSFQITKCYLHLNDQLISELNIESLQKDSILIPNLHSNNNYKLYIEYSYDLSDGKGVISKRILKEFITPLKEQEELIPDISEDEIDLTVDDIAIPTTGYTNITPTYTINDNDTVTVNFKVPSQNGTRIVLIYDPTDVANKLLLRYTILYALQNSDITLYVVDLSQVISDETISTNDVLLASAKRYLSANIITVDKVKVLSNFSIPISTTYEEYVKYIESYINQ